MKSTLTIISVIFAMVFCFSTVSADSGNKGDKPNPNEKTFKKYDKDGNGILDANEKQALLEDLKDKKEIRKAKLRERYDLNQDGKFDKDEIKIMKEDRERIRQYTHSVALRKYDFNKNGVIDPEERQIMRRDNALFLEKLKQQRSMK